MNKYTCVTIHRPDYRGQLALCSSSFEEGLFSSLYLFNKPETYSFGVRPASLIALIIDPRLALFSSLSATETTSMVPGIRWGIRERDCTAARYTKIKQKAYCDIWKIVSFDLSATWSSEKKLKSTAKIITKVDPAQPSGTGRGILLWTLLKWFYMFKVFQLKKRSYHLISLWATTTKRETAL